jgi:hypothetical protein
MVSMSEPTPEPTTPDQPPPPPPGPPPAYQAAAPAYAAPPAAWGPPGKPRSIGISILLAIVTLGIYALVWVYKTHDEMKRHCGQGIGGGLGFVIYFFIAPVTFFLLPNEVEKMLAQAGRPSRVSAMTGFWLFLPIAGAFVWFFKVQGQLNDYWESLGAHR